MSCWPACPPARAAMWARPATSRQRSQRLQQRAVLYGAIYTLIENGIEFAQALAAVVRQKEKAMRHMTWLAIYSVAVATASAVAAPCAGIAADHRTPLSGWTIPAGAAASPAVAVSSGTRSAHAGTGSSAPVPSSGAGGMSKRPEDAGKANNPDNMPIKRPDSKTNDRILRDHLPSDAIAR